MNILIEYAPLVLVLVCFLLREKVFVTPVQLEIKHRKILEEVADKFSTKEENQYQSSEIKEMKAKIDKIYDKIMDIE